MLRLFQDQLARIDRLLVLVNARDQQALIGTALTFEDILIFACQCTWHLRDWILNDPYFAFKDRSLLLRDIETNKYLIVCADLANSSKHFSLSRARTDITESEFRGIRYDHKEGIFQITYYLEAVDINSEFNGMEIRDFLKLCRIEWEHIINAHHLSSVDVNSA